MFFSVPNTGLQGEKHRPHAPGHCSLTEEQQERPHLRADGHRPDCHVPLGGTPSLLQGPGGFQRGWKETHAEEDWWAVSLVETPLIDDSGEADYVEDGRKEILSESGSQRKLIKYIINKFLWSFYCIKANKTLRLFCKNSSKLANY